MEEKPKVIIDSPPVPILRTFHQQLFGPWNLQDPKVQQQIVRTQPSAGSSQKRFAATYPPAPTISQGKSAITGGFEFAFNTVPNAAGYNIYSAAVNNPNVATLIGFQAQPPNVQSLQSVKFQDVTSATLVYFVASVNQAGKESVRVPVTGNAAPMPNPSQPLPSGGGSGRGSGGGGGLINKGGRFTL